MMASTSTSALGSTFCVWDLPREAPHVHSVQQLPAGDCRDAPISTWSPLEPHSLCLCFIPRSGVNFPYSKSVQSGTREREEDRESHQ